LSSIEGRRGRKSRPFTASEDGALLAIFNSVAEHAAAHRYAKQCMDWPQIKDTLDEVAESEGEGEAHSKAQLQARLGQLKKEKKRFKERIELWKERGESQEQMREKLGL
jgi:hypothetical protein